MKDTEIKVKRQRGRPKSSSQPPVFQQILDAAETLLKNHNYADLTERMIASAAGVNESMIHYYFGDKDGLFLSILDEFYSEAVEKLKELEALDLHSKDITQQVIHIVASAYYSKYWISRMAATELYRGNSTLKEAYLKKYGSKGKTLHQLEKIISKLVDAGIYSQDTNITHTTLSMASIIMAPLALAPFYDGALDFDQLGSDPWACYIADLFDHQLRG